MTVLRIAAPAKLNLHLEVLGRRADGFHALESIFQTIALHDVVELRLRSAPGIALTCDDASLPVDQGNLAWRAAAAFLGRAPASGVAIALAKRIPHGAGLGGGSSDAAAVLRGLARLLPGLWSADGLAGLAAALGSDVPFFLIGGSAHGTGRGEILTALPDLPAQPVTVLMPDASLATPAVFKAMTEAERGPRDLRGAAWWRPALARTAWSRTWTTAWRPPRAACAPRWAPCWTGWPARGSPSSCPAPAPPASPSPTSHPRPECAPGIPLSCRELDWMRGRP